MFNLTYPVTDKEGKKILNESGLTIVVADELLDAIQKIPQLIK